MGYDHQIQRLKRALFADPQNPTLRRRYMAVLSRSHGRDVLRVLDRRQEWLNTDHHTQEVAAAVVSRSLGANWEPLGAEQFACAGLQHRIFRFKHRPSNLTFHLIPGGQTLIGSERGVLEASPRVEVSIPPLLVARYPTRQLEWDGIGGFDRRKWTHPELPIEGVNYKDILEWLSKAGDGLRLPSEAEWEYATRAGSLSSYYWGDDMDPGYCWFKRNSKSRTYAPAEHDHQANAFGLVDTLGNVFEVCLDRYFPDYHGDFPKNGQARGDLSGTKRVRRSGSWSTDADSCESSYRRPHPRWKRTSTLGFRAVRSLPVIARLQDA